MSGRSSGKASFTLATSMSTYELPGDFSRYHYDILEHVEPVSALCPMSPQEYAGLRGEVYTALPNDMFAVRGVTDNEILIYPTPG